MKRFLHIDFLRAAGILGVIIIHVFSDNLTNSLNTFIWNYLHFIIVAFIFCSGYVMYALYAPKLTNFKTIALWYKKRLIRLLLPFYWYLLAHYALMFLFPHFFSGLGIVFSWKFLLDSVTLIGGINLNWLPLLFLQLAVLFPILIFIFKKQKVLFWGYVIFAFLTTLAFTIWQFPYAHYRMVMWIPWSLFLVLPWFISKIEQKKLSFQPYMWLSLLGGIIFVGLFTLWQQLGRSLTLIDNKYPPNFFYISYESFGSFGITALSFIAFFQKKLVVNFYQFLSRTSYSLFFIHYIVLDFTLSLQRVYSFHLSVWAQLLFILTISCLIAWGISFLQGNKLFNKPLRLLVRST